MLTNEAVRGAVETIATNLVLLVIFVWQCIEISVIRHGLMESCIEHTYLWNIWQNSLYSSYTFQIGRIMQWSKVVASLKCFQNFRCQESRFRELLAAMHHAMSYCIDFIQ